MEVSEEFFKLAMLGSPMPRSLNSAQQRLYQSLCFLYARYKAGFISADDAKREKAEILNTYEIDNLHLRAFQDTVELRVKLGEYLNERAVCPICKQAGRLLDGRSKDYSKPSPDLATASKRDF